MNTEDMTVPEAMKEGFKTGVLLTLDSLKITLDSGVDTDNLDRETAEYIIGLTRMTILMSLKELVDAKAGEAGE